MLFFDFKVVCSFCYLGFTIIDGKFYDVGTMILFESDVIEMSKELGVLDFDVLDIFDVLIFNILFLIDLFVTVLYFYDGSARIFMDVLE